MNEERRVQRQVDKGGGWWSGDFFEQGQGDQERWIGIEGVAEKEFDGEAADFDVSAADGRVVLEGEPRAREM
jgi:hypothetical protein